MKGQTEGLHPDLTDLLEELEEDMGFELTVVSGKRDLEHNVKVGGVTDSEHTYEQAEGVDVLCKQSVTRYKMVQWLFSHGVTRVGVGESFIHIGIAEDKPQYVMWHYYPKASA